MASTNRVAIAPGAIAFTCTTGASSRASVSVSATSAAFAVVYAGDPGRDRATAGAAAREVHDAAATRCEHLGHERGDRRAQARGDRSSIVAGPRAEVDVDERADRARGLPRCSRGPRPARARARRCAGDLHPPRPRRRRRPCATRVSVPKRVVELGGDARRARPPSASTGRVDRAAAARLAPRRPRRCPGPPR